MSLLKKSSADGFPYSNVITVEIILVSWWWVVSSGTC